MKITIFTAVLALPTQVRGSDKREIHNVLSDSAAGIMINAPSNNNFIDVGTLFTVPEAHLPDSANVSVAHNASIWTGLGMDSDMGFKDGNASLIRAGIRLSVAKSANGSQTTSYNAWYQWLPDYSVEIDGSDFPVAAGDKIKTKVRTVSNKNFGVVFIQNLRTRMVQEHALIQHSCNKTNPLLGSCADLVVSGDDKLADFGTIEFAITEIGTTKPFKDNIISISDLLNDAERWNMIDSAGTIANTTILDETRVQVKFIGA